MVQKLREEEWAFHYNLEKIQLIFLSIMYLIATDMFDLVSLVKK